VQQCGQVWGISPYEEVESLLRLFLKKIFRLPRFTPNRMLYLETGLSPLHKLTDKMTFRYIQKVVTMPENRLPRVLANFLVQERKQWVIEWETLAETYGERLQLGDPSQWSQWAKSILAHTDETYRTQFKMESRRSTTRMTHRSLNYDLGLDNYFTDAFTVEKIRTIFMARGEILPLSYIPNVTASDTVCPIFNMKEQENVVHFMTCSTGDPPAAFW